MSAGTAIAKAYVQIMPSTEGISSGIQNALNGASGATQGAANSIKGNLVGAFKAVKSAMIALPFAKLGIDAVKLGKEFDASMSSVYSLMSSAHDGAGLTSEEMKDLRENARQMGATTQFSAKQAAEAMGYMALAGWDVDQVTTALPDVLHLAAAAGMDLGQASDIVTDYMSAFSNSELTAAEMSDKLAYAQANSNTTVSALAEAYQNCAAVMNAGGQTFDTTTAMLEAMANQGYKGARAGTALTAMQRDLTAHMKKGSITINKQKIAVQDSNGNYRSMIDILRDVDKATQGMGDAQKAAALSSIFTADSIKGVNLLLNEGIENVAGYAAELENSGGSAEKMGKILNDNLSGDMKTLNSSFEDLKITLSDLLTPAIRFVVQGLTGLLQKFNALPEPAKKAILGFTGIFSVFMALKPLLPLLSGALGALNLPLIALAGAVAWVVSKSKAFQDIVNKVKEGLSKFFTTLEQGGTPMEAFQAAIEAVAGAEAWNTIKGVIDTVKGAIELLKGAFDNAVEGLDAFFTSLMNGEGLGAAWEAMKSKFSEFDWAGLATTAKEAIQNGFTGFSEWLKGLFETAKTLIAGIDWAAVGTAVLNGIKTILTVGGEWLKSIFDSALAAVKTVDWAGIGTAILDGIKSILTAGGEWLKGIFDSAHAAVGGMDWGAIGTAIFNGIKTILTAGGEWLKGLFDAGLSAVTSIDFSGIGTAILNGVKAMIDAAGGFLKALFTAGKDAAAGVDYSGLGESVLNGVKGSIDTAGSFLTGLFTTARDAVASLPFGSIGETILSGVTASIDTAGNFLSAGFEAAKTTIASIQWPNIAEAFSGLSTFMDSTGAFLSSGFEAASKAISNIKWSDVGNVISTGLSAAVSTLASIGKSVWDTITGWFSGQNGETPATTASDFVGDVAGGITGNGQTAKNAAEAVGTEVLFALQNKLSAAEGQKIGKTITDAIKNALDASKAALKASADTLAKVIADAFNNYKWNDVGRNIVNKIKTALDNNSSQLKSAGEKAAGKIADGLDSKDWNSIGKSIMQGVANGIRNNTSIVTSAARDAASAAYEAAKDELDINSPSKVFAEGIGRAIPEGIAKGIHDYTYMAEDAVGTMAGNLLDDSALRASALASGDFSGTASSNNGFTQNVTVNAPTPLSPWEIARQTRNATRGMILAVRGV